MPLLISLFYHQSAFLYSWSYSTSSVQLAPPKPISPLASEPSFSSSSCHASLSHTLSMPPHLSLASPVTPGSGHKACRREASRVEEKGSVDTISLSTCSVIFLLNLNGVSTPSQASGILNCHVSKPVGVGNDVISVFFLILYMQLESEHVDSMQISPY
jgi:hypothetical protein